MTCTFKRQPLFHITLTVKSLSQRWPSYTGFTVLALTASKNVCSGLNKQQRHRLGSLLSVHIIVIFDYFINGLWRPWSDCTDMLPANPQRHVFCMARQAVMATKNCTMKTYRVLNYRQPSLYRLWIFRYNDNLTVMKAWLKR